jgi:hypothetical protein
MPGVQGSQKAWEIAKQNKKNENLQRQGVQAQTRMDTGHPNAPGDRGAW